MGPHCFKFNTSYPWYQRIAESSPSSYLISCFIYYCALTNILIFLLFIHSSLLSSPEPKARELFWSPVVRLSVNFWHFRPLPQNHTVNLDYHKLYTTHSLMKRIQTYPHEVYQIFILQNSKNTFMIYSSSSA